MTQVNVREPKTHLSKLLDQAIAGEEVQARQAIGNELRQHVASS